MPSPSRRLTAALQFGRAVVADQLGRLTRQEPADQPVAPEVELPAAWADFARSLTVTAALDASPERVFATLTDLDGYAGWLTFHDGWSGGAPGRASVGASVAEKVKLMGTPAKVVWTVLALDAPHRLVLEGRGPAGVSLGVAYSVTPHGTGSLLRCDGVLDGEPLRGPVGPMLTRNVQDSLSTSLTKLAALLAGGGPAEPSRPAPAPRPARPAPLRDKPAPIRHHRSGQDIDPWTPVIVGVGQYVERTPSLDALREPAELAAQALRRAAADTGVPNLLQRADSVRCVASASWSYQDEAAVIAQLLGLAPRETVQTAKLGGDGGQRLLNATADDIAQGLVDIALLGGAEAAASAALADKQGVSLDWTTQPDDVAPTRVIGVDKVASTDAEDEVGLVAPIPVYPLIEHAIRAKQGTDPATHLARISALWSRFSSVAAANPYAVLPREYSADELATPSADNRPVADPYPKLLNANLQVDLATGIVVASAWAAERAGVPQEQWVFVHAGANAEEEWFVTERPDLAAAPAIGAMGRAALEHAGIGVGDLTHVDLYACFPSAVQIAASELGLSLERDLTVTGGLTFAGGPGNNYTSHAIATMVPLLRADPDAYGLTTAVGWYLTKNAVGIYSARPPRQPFRAIDAGAWMSRPAPRAVVTGHRGPAVVEAYTVTYGRDGKPDAVILTALTDAGERVLARSSAPEVVAAALADPLGQTVELDGATVLGISAVEPAVARAQLETATAARQGSAREPLVRTEWDGPLCVITLNRPDVKNAIDFATAQALERAVDAFEADREARVAIITGAGGTFCSGMDLKAAARGEYPLTERRGPLGIAQRPPTKPLIAAVEGYALAGGCELALSADLIVASDDSQWGIPEPKRGLVAAAGGVLRLAERLPYHVAMELALTGDPMPGRRLHGLGLINRLVAPGTTLTEARALALAIAANAPLSVELSKRIVTERHDWSTAEAFQRQSDLASDALFSADATEGVRAFAEHRPPVWQGR
ncbi:MAG: type II toxin-antitoxin system Rv0910 family toxin [Jatrophihabitans sp.]|uniref:type II toxin-antitoxin system Rv0910 family toxin n=1 Tax=Jatrophihabitans sp. TaxID=1932789 RepID=UPI003F7ED1A7